jgi:glycosyltransferase involved in cell wall biosynthesis
LTRLLTLVGDPTSVETRGGQPFFFLQASLAQGFLDGGLALKPEKLKTQRIWWNLFSLLTSGQKGGYQYTPHFLKSLFHQANLGDGDIEFISYFPLLPPAPWLPNWQVNYYIDATLKQNFIDYEIQKIVSNQVQKETLNQERENYQASKRIICRSSWAATSVIQDYDADPKKVHVILPGASVPDDLATKAIALLKDPVEISMKPLRLGFVGVDWRRKRLPYLLEVAQHLDARKIPVEVVVVGPDATKLPTNTLLRPMGYVSKQKNIKKFIRLVTSFHFTCLFSSVEGQGQSILESLRLGVPVLGTNAGGIPDSIPEDLGFVFELETPPSSVADLLESFVKDPSLYHTLRQRVISRAEEFSWNNTVQNFIQLWEGSDKFRYAKF